MPVNGFISPKDAKSTPQAFRAPGRVNLIGEHTDYTGGFVLPMAIDFHTAARVRRADEDISIYSESFGEEVQFNESEVPQDGRGHWSDYPLGVRWALQEKGIEIPPFDLSLASDVPLGAGLSSSASVEVATAHALLDVAGATLPSKEIALLCKHAENDFVHSPCGIMDQFVIVHAVEGKALLLDCRSLEYDLLPLPEGVRVVICNSMVKHAVGEGPYGNRRAEVETGQAVLRERRGIALLRDATLADLQAEKANMPEESYKRCRHIITENVRVLAARDALLGGRTEEFGELLKQAHASYRDDFEASCDEVEVLIALAAERKGCYGSRLTGGGFGGCTVNIVQTDAVETFVQEMGEGYKARTGIDAQIFVTPAADGALALAEKETQR